MPEDSVAACDRVQRLVERPSQMINFRAGVFGRTIQKLRQIVVLLVVMRRFISPAGNLLNSFLPPTALLPASNRFHGSATKEG